MPTHTELKILQALPLEIKIEKTKQRIREWVNYWGKDGVYVSFSGGKDSTVLLDLVRSEFPNIVAVFIDTGLEYPEIKKFVSTFDNVETLKPKLTFKQVLDKYGFPIISKEVSRAISYYRKGSKWAYKKLNGESFLDMTKWKYLADSDFKISDECCFKTKKEPVKIYEKKTGKKAITGMLADESLLRKNSWIDTGCNSFESKRPISSPLSFWTEQDILKYIYDKGLKIAKVYGNVIQVDLVGERFELTGVKRTGCMFCMFGVHLEKGENRFQRMKRTHPKIYDYCIREENGLGLGKVLDYIGVKY